MADFVATCVRFGPFKLDLRPKDLHKGPTRLKVPDQSIEILKALLERPGELVKNAAVTTTQAADLRTRIRPPPPAEGCRSGEVPQ